jgi:hypothetical protein
MVNLAVQTPERAANQQTNDQAQWRAEKSSTNSPPHSGDESHSGRHGPARFARVRLASMPAYQTRCQPAEAVDLEGLEAHAGEDADAVVRGVSLVARSDRAR